MTFWGPEESRRLCWRRLHFWITKALQKNDKLRCKQRKTVLLVFVCLFICLFNAIGQVIFLFSASEGDN